MCPCDVACADWWVFLHNPWVFCCFLVACSLLFKLLSPFIFPILFLCASPSPLTLAIILTPLQRFLLPICAAFFLRYVFLFLFFVTCYEFLISSFFLSLFFNDCCCFSVWYWFSSVCFATYCVFFWVFMVGSSEVRIACPSISFLFARLGGVIRCFPAR